MALSKFKILLFYSISAWKTGYGEFFLNKRRLSCLLIYLMILSSLGL